MAQDLSLPVFAALSFTGKCFFLTTPQKLVADAFGCSFIHPVLMSGSFPSYSAALEPLLRPGVGRERSQQWEWKCLGVIIEAVIVFLK